KFSFSQINYSSNNNDDNNVYLNIPAEEEINQKDRIYYNFEWQKGNIIKKDSTIMTNLSFRYDVKNDRFEMWSLVNPNSLKIITLNGKFFIYSTYKDRNYERKGYFELIIDGYAKLLIKKALKTIPGKSGAYGYSSRQAIIETYYLKVGDNPAILFDVKKKDVETLFPEKIEKVKDFISNNNINLKRTEDMIKIVRYYNTLFANS
ncbi:MAG: hypothetical protein JXA16_12555, partial [Bacteroidales bacterium]|nr:hypothetical protein [Bacteroidales bacterium]